MSARETLVSIRSLYVLLPFLLAACAGLPPLGTGGQLRLTDDEQQLWQKALVEEHQLSKSGRLFQDPLLEDYLRQLGERLIPEAAKQDPQVAFRFVVIMDPTLNAFAYPNGMICIHSGLLARLENEAQLAIVLSHEIIHVINRHAGTVVRDTKRIALGKTLASALISLPLQRVGVSADPSAAEAFMGLLRQPTSGVASLAGKAAPIIGVGMELTLILSLRGYGEKMEREADVQGMALLARAGYDPLEVPKVFSLLMNTFGDRSDVEMYLTGNHPETEERLATANHLLKTVYRGAASEGNRWVNAEEFLMRTRRLVRENAVLDIELGRYHTAKTQLERVLRLLPSDPEALYYLGEVYRRKGEEGDIDKAAEAYRRALSSDPTYAAPHKGLGLLYYTTHQREMAKAEFEAYLESAPTAQDTRVIKDYLFELKQDSGGHTPAHLDTDPDAGGPLPRALPPTRPPEGTTQ